MSCTNKIPATVDEDKVIGENSKLTKYYGSSKEKVDYSKLKKNKKQKKEAAAVEGDFIRAPPIDDEAGLDEQGSDPQQQLLNPAKGKKTDDGFV